MWLRLSALISKNNFIKLLLPLFNAWMDGGIDFDRYFQSRISFMHIAYTLMSFSIFNRFNDGFIQTYFNVQDQD